MPKSTGTFLWAHILRQPQKIRCTNSEAEVCVREKKGAAHGGITGRAPVRKEAMELSIPYTGHTDMETKAAELQGGIGEV